MKEEKFRVSSSPVLPLPLSPNGCVIKIKRDDLLPHFMGGNKVRKNFYILNELTDLPDVLITNGGVESNHARVCALIASYLGIKCHLVLHGSKVSSPFLSGNEFFIGSTDAEISYVEPNDISCTIENLKNKYSADGLEVFVIPGGAHSLTGAKAYIAAVEELTEEPDFILFPSGTGATHAGILAGVKSRNWSTTVIGVSVARQVERGISAINELYLPLCEELNLEHDINDIVFLDDFTFEGYAKYSSELVKFIKNIVAKTGVPFDPVYSGKAFYGLIELIERAVIPSNSNVLFWHTGGLLNLQTSKDIYDKNQ